MTYEEELRRVYSRKDLLSSYLLKLRVRKGDVERVLKKPAACYYLYKGSLVDPYDTQIPLHRLSGLERAEGLCEAFDLGWAWAVVCDCGGGRAVRGPRGYDPVFALSGPPYPLVSKGEVIACLPEGRCSGGLVKRGLWYWYY
ncbi:hypothetical protein [Ignicoccus hospitalis]|uniref:Uncharacterized protein n=1 Tax=Ignicoccus hospitalis (strain KIN4/I / DSM 18386 / JCM 14125) TaxID=453591 RepID=A8AA93_IGNH4|nr:hypothetical protein [Ignicoccus hospitalis]ABU81845.1 hypothetical protein Igni_0663 [Ignicoccus hospitalis KIN4/I]HIH90113.1 hypothetical protein [Desulfurococcaceae archaeon]